MEDVDAMGEAAARFEDAVVDLVQQAATGGLEVTDGRKRWQFFFDDGRLVCTRSNLKGEQDPALKEAYGELDSDAMARAQAVLRFKNACSSEGISWKFHLGVQPPHRRPVPLAPVLIEGVAQGREPQSLKQAIGPLWERFPRLKGDPSALGLDSEQIDLLRQLDGERRMEDVVSSAKVRRTAMATLWLAARFGLLEEGSGAAAPTSDLDMDFDIDSLIAEEVAQNTSDALGPDITPMLISQQKARPGGSLAHQSEPPPPRVTPTAAPKAPAARGPASVGPTSKGPVSKGPASQSGSKATTPEGRLKELDRQVYGADNYFQMFGLPWNAATEQFRQRFTDFARELHPDRYVGAPEPTRQLATDLFDRIRSAWEVIQNETERKKYTDRVIHGKKSDEEEAMEKVQAYYKAEGDFKRGLSAFTNGRTIDAHGFFKSAVEACPDEFEFLMYYGYTLFFTSRAKDPHLAAQGISLIQRVLRSNEKQARKLDNGWVLLGRAWRDQGDFNEALRAFKTAYEINPSNSDAKRQYMRTKEQMEGAEQTSGFFARILGKDGKPR